MPEYVKKAVVVGLGNPILADDAAGIEAAKLAYESLDGATREDVDLKILSLGGLSLMEELEGYRFAVIADAFYAPNEPVGRVLRFTVEDIERTRPQGWVSMHEISVPEALKLTRLLELAMPENIIILAICVNDPYSFGEELSEGAKAASLKASEAIRKELLDLIK